MAKVSVSVDVPLPPEKAWECASDLTRYKEWLSIHRVWRSKLPETLEKGTVVESIVEVKGMPNRIKWTIVHFKPPEAMTLNGDGRGGVKVKLIGKVKPSEKDSGASTVRRCSGRSAWWWRVRSRGISASRSTSSSRCSPRLSSASGHQNGGGS